MFSLENKSWDGHLDGNTWYAHARSTYWLYNFAMNFQKDMPLHAQGARMGTYLHNILKL